MASIVDQCLRENCCTFVRSGITNLEQPFYVCDTCTAAGRFGENEGICEICAKLCHNGHAISDTGGADFYCHCGALGCDATHTSASMCLNCGLPLSKNSSFCFNCGTELNPSKPKKEIKRQTVVGEDGCEACGYPLDAEQSHCPECGKKNKKAHPTKHAPTQELRSKLKLLDVTPETTQLKFEGVWMDVYRIAKDEGRDMRMQWIVRNTREFNPISFTFDFDGCKGVTLNGPTKQTVTVPPDTTMKVAEISSTDPTKGYALAVGFSYALQKKDDDAVRKHNEKELKKTREAEQKIASLGFDKKTPIGKIISAVTSAGLKFVDKDFPPEKTSIWKSGPNPLPYKEVIWQRPEQFMKSVNLFQGIDPTDINQGVLGNCWFCCALSSLAEFPNLIMDLFHEDSKKTNKAGAYQLKFYNETDVEPVIVIVDDLFPCIPGGGPVFTHNKGEEIWVLLIEKAYAKMMSCYFQLKSGTPGDAFSDFTGCPVESFNFEEKKIKAKIADQSFWKDLLTWDKRKCVMAAGKYGEDKFTESGLDPSNKAGLVPGHAYSLIEVKEGLGVRLVKLRNPWGRFEWKGDWGDHSKLWTKQAIDHFKPEFKDDDGVFWMDYRHFLVNFDNVEVCYATSPSSKKWHQKRWKGNFAVKAPFNATQFYEIDLGRETDMFFSIFQADQRIPGAPDCVEVGILVADDSGNLAAATEIRAKNRVCGPSHGVTLGPGKFTIIPFTAGARFRKSSHTSHTFVFGVHADDDDGIQLQPISANLDLLNRTRLDHLRQNGTKQVWNGHSVYSFVDANLSSFGIEAGSDKKTDIEFTLDFTGSKNVFSAMGGLKVSKTLKPGTGAIFQDLAIDNPDVAMSLTYGIQAKFVKSA